MYSAQEMSKNGVWDSLFFSERLLGLWLFESLDSLLPNFLDGSLLYILGKNMVRLLMSMACIQVFLFSFIHKCNLT